MKVLLVTLFVGSVFAIPPFDRETPTFTLNQERNFDGSPSISITFPDGYQDNLVLTNQNQDRNDDNCIYLGHFEKETSACVAMTGCPGSEDLEFTIFSSHSERSGTMKWNLDGSVKLLEHRIGFEIPKTIGLPAPRNDVNWLLDGDEEFNQGDVDTQMEIEKECENGACDDKIQRTHVLSYKVQ